ncbi:MAG: hypothetical protein QXE96_02200 [Candidatus Caldarchaeum sp.]
MSSLSIVLPPRFAASCLLGLLYHIDTTYQLSYDGEKVTIRGPDVLAALKDVLTTAEQMLKRRQRARMNIPANKNDKKIVREFMSAYELGANATVLDLIGVLKSNPTANVGQFKLPSILKPEYYEFNRVPGYTGTENAKKMLQSYPGLSIALSIVGYMVCRVGVTKIDNNERVSVVVTPEFVAGEQRYVIDPGYRLSTFVDSFNALDRLQVARNGVFTGLFPEVALHLWMALQMKSAKINLHAIREPGGQNPATIYSSMSIDLEPTYRAMNRYDLYKVSKHVEYIVEKALNIGVKQDVRSLCMRLATLLYEVLNNTQELSEFVYVASRENLQLQTQTHRNQDVYWVSVHAARIAHHLSRFL